MRRASRCQGLLAIAVFVVPIGLFYGFVHTAVNETTAFQSCLALIALVELDEDGLEPEDALEAVLNAQGIKKTMRSQSRRRGRVVEKLYVIESFTYRGTLLYTKGKIARSRRRSVLLLHLGQGLPLCRLDLPPCEHVRSADLAAWGASRRISACAMVPS